MGKAVEILNLECLTATIFQRYTEASKSVECKASINQYLHLNQIKL